MAGRASDLQSEGAEFDPRNVHMNKALDIIEVMLLAVCIFICLSLVAKLIEEALVRVAEMVSNWLKK